MSLMSVKIVKIFVVDCKNLTGHYLSLLSFGLVMTSMISCFTKVFKDCEQQVDGSNKSNSCCK